MLTAALLHNTDDPKQLFKLCGWAEPCAHIASGVYRGSTTCELKLPLSTPTCRSENRKSLSRWQLLPKSNAKAELSFQDPPCCQCNAANDACERAHASIKHIWLSLIMAALTAILITCGNGWGNVRTMTMPGIPSKPRARRPQRRGTCQ